MYKSQYTFKRKIEHYMADKPRLSKQFMKYTGSDDDFFSFSNLSEPDALRATDYVLREKINN